jgi:hypothetical protein
VSENFQVVRFSIRFCVFVGSGTRNHIFLPHGPYWSCDYLGFPFYGQGFFVYAQINISCMVKSSYCFYLKSLRGCVYQISFSFLTEFFKISRPIFRWPAKENPRSKWSVGWGEMGNLWIKVMPKVDIPYSLCHLADLQLGRRIWFKVFIFRTGSFFLRVYL